MIYYCSGDSVFNLGSKYMNKQVLLILNLIAVLLLAFSCKKPESKPAVVDVEVENKQILTVEISVIRSSHSYTPTWANYSWLIEKDNKSKERLYITVLGRSSSRKDAKALIDNSDYVEAILFNKLFELAQEHFIEVSYDIIDKDGKLENLYNKLIDKMIADINVKSFIPNKNYWEHVLEKQGERIRTYYRFFRQYSIDYDLFKKNMLAIFSSAVEKSPNSIKPEVQIILERLEKLYETN